MTGLRFLSCAFFLATSAATAAVLTEGEVVFDGDNLFVGQVQDGALTVTPPDVLAVDFLAIAHDPGIVGTVLIDGAGITTQHGLSIGSHGIGTLTIQNGGLIDTKNSLAAGLGAYGLGRLEIIGQSSTASLAGGSGTTFFLVGGSGQGSTQGFGRGEVNVSQGGELITGHTTIGGDGSAEVIIEGNSSLWRNLGEMRFGNASLTLRDGGHLIQASSNPENSILFGSYRRGLTSVLIHGQGSLLSSTGKISIGELGQAIVRVEGGADVVANATTLGERNFQGGGLRRGTLELDGFGTTWNTNELTLGVGEGHAEVRITGGAILNVTGHNRETVLGLGDNSTVVVTVDGPNSRWINSGSPGIQGFGDLIIGDGGRGELRITGGAYHENGGVIINNANSKVLVSGAGSHWDVRDDLDIIQGEVIVADGASMQLPRGFLIRQEGHLRFNGGELLGNPDSFSLSNQGLLSGDGTIEAPIRSFSTGAIHVGSGQRLEAESLVSSGLLVIEEGEFRLSGTLSNTGQIDLRDATLRAGSINLKPTRGAPAEMRFLGGDNQVHADFISLVGRTIVRGNSTVTFFGDVSNDGFFSVANGSTVYFLDQFISFDDVYGDGHIVFEGDIRLGTDTAFGTDLTFAPTSSWTVGLFGGNGSLVSDGTVDLGGELSLGSILLPVGPGIHELTIIEAALVEDTFDFLPEIDSLIGHRTFFRGIEYTDTTVVLLVELLAEGDFNGDGLVDAADYDAWANDFGSTTGDSLADGNGDGLVNAADYTLWRDAMDGELPASVPEPTGLAMCLLLGLALQGHRFRL